MTSLPGSVGSRLLALTGFDRIDGGESLALRMGTPTSSPAWTAILAAATRNVKTLKYSNSYSYCKPVMLA